MLNNHLSLWLNKHADALDCGSGDPEQLLPQLASSGVLGLGVAETDGGSGGTIVDALNALSQLARHSLTAAFVYWGQRAFIEYLLRSDNHELRERLLKDLLLGHKAGATGLSNAMKYLSGIEALGVSAINTTNGWEFNGRLPWVTNLRKSGFVVAAAVDLPGAQPFVVALPDDVSGLERSEDLELLGLRCSNTAAIDLKKVTLGREWLIAADARPYLQKIRPAFLGLQCGLSIGLAQGSLQQTEQLLGGSRSVLRPEWQLLNETLNNNVAQLHEGLSDGRFTANPVALFNVRIALAHLATAAVQLELQASGGKAYIQPQGKDFARRLRESAFVPVVTPSLVQLRTELARHAKETAA